jgi:hypothetical protein
VVIQCINYYNAVYGFRAAIATWAKPIGVGGNTKEFTEEITGSLDESSNGGDSIEKRHWIWL